jgi:hypothetical protein
MAGVLFLRCQYTYKAAAGMALSGQVVETFVMMRSCLEYAGYVASRQHGRHENAEREIQN